MPNLSAEEYTRGLPPWCGFCAGQHKFQNEVCQFCNLCFNACIREPQCRWKKEEYNPDPKSVNQPVTSTHNLAENIPNHNLKEAFECWLASSQYISVHDGVDIESLWKDFDAFAKEVLTPVEVNRTYLLMKLDKGTFEMLPPTNLFRNENGEYVQLDGKRRIRIGQNVAVM